MDETNLKAYCDRALLCAGRYGAQYADIRIVDGFEQFIMVEDGQLEASSTGRSYGFGVRMYLGGAWGFASSCKVTADEIDKVVEQAATIAKANAKVNKIPAILARGEPCQSFYVTECKTDPVSLPFEDKFRHLMEVDKAMGLPGISHRCNLILVTRKNKAFASSDGSFIRRNETDTSSYASARVIDDKGSVRRSVPERGLHAGWEFVRSRDMTAKPRSAPGKP
jgi:TldD protein